jgi:ketosteroid isomerase-like protein
MSAPPLDAARYVGALATCSAAVTASRVAAVTRECAVETRYAVLYEIRGGKITRMAIYSKPAEALEAAGLRE